MFDFCAIATAVVVISAVLQNGYPSNYYVVYSLLVHTLYVALQYTLYVQLLYNIWFASTFINTFSLYHNLCVQCTLYNVHALSLTKVGLSNGFRTNISIVSVQSIIGDSKQSYLFQTLDRILQYSYTNTFYLYHGPCICRLLDILLISEVKMYSYYFTMMILNSGKKKL